MNQIDLGFRVPGILYKPDPTLRFWNQMLASFHSFYSLDIAQAAMPRLQTRCTVLHGNCVASSWDAAKE